MSKHKTKVNAISKPSTTANSTIVDPSTTVELTCEEIDQEASGLHGPTKTSIEEEIRALAYSKWEAAGCAIGDGTEFWLAAEQELCNANSNQGGSTAEPNECH